MADIETLTTLKKLYDEARWDTLLSTALDIFEEENPDQDIAYIAASAAYSLNDLIHAKNLLSSVSDQTDLSFELCDFIATLSAEIGHIKNATFYAKMSLAFPHSPDLVDFRPSLLPSFSDAFSEMQETPLFRRALHCLALDDLKQSLHWLDQAIQDNQAPPDAYLLQQSLLLRFGRLHDALQTILGARHRYPDNASIAMTCAALLSLLGNPPFATSVFQDAKNLSPDNLNIALAEILHLVGSPDAPPQDVLKTLAATACQHVLPVKGNPRQTGDRDLPLTIGYLAPGFDRTVPLSTFAALLHAHNRKDFRIVVFGPETLNDRQNSPFQGAVDKWHNISHADGWTIDMMVQGENIDILVDIGGYFSPSTYHAMGASSAPVRLSWLGAPAGLGYPGTLQIGDPFLDRSNDPFSIGNIALLSENSLLLPFPDSLEPSGNSDLTPPDTEATLRFGADITFQELTPRTVRLFAEVLRAVPQSTLQLLDHDFHHPSGIEHITNLFGAFGLSHRTEVTSSMSAEDFFLSSDIVLAPPHTLRALQVLTALSCGRPTLCLDADTRWGRMGAAIVNAAGLSETMLARSETQYIELAKQWAQNPSQRARFATHGPAAIKRSMAFDIPRLAQDLETLFIRLWRRSGD